MAGSMREGQMGLVERLTEAQLDTIEKHGVGIGDVALLVREVREARADGLRLQAEVERLRYALQQVVARAPVSMEWAIDFARIAMRKAGE